MSDWTAGQSSILKWSPNNVTWNSNTGTLNFTLDKAPRGSRLPYVSGEIESNQTAQTGTWSWTAQAPELTSGSIFGLFTYKADWANDPWLEFDFEFLGKDGGDWDGDGDIDINVVRLNIHMETASGQHVTLEDANGGPIKVNLGFDATEGQHTYAVTVTGTEAIFTVDGTEVGRYDATDMPGGTWINGEMKSFVNLWAVDTKPEMEAWAGKWTYPGHPLVGKVSAVEYAPLGGTSTLIGGPAPKPAVTVQGTNGPEDLRDVLKRSDVLEGAGGQDRFLFVSPGLNAKGDTVTSRGGTAEKDVIWDFNPDAGAEHDITVISKSLAGVSQFSALYRNVSDVNGEAVLKFADGSTLTFHGLHKADLSYDDFALV
ncbi:glycoside hydrolase, family 16 [Rubellimicrobium mesophilum DSM 19309]|uniref:Glycoside hydrolase, family 16 n=1 Tax=Rubellimicrobium mesophilum DSM 19309 TaxID=442562 RepID=A0A017HPZ1_9RHOB|nr:glycoside hydrolase, family 16 [Rubellimicrobium mesophilum DSM 19309]